MLQTIVSELVAHKDFKIEDVQNKILLLYAHYCAEWENFSARQNHIENHRKVAWQKPEKVKYGKHFRTD